LFRRQIQTIVRQPQILDGGSPNVGRAQFPKAVAGLRRANDLLQRQVHVGVRDRQATIVRFTALELDQDRRALGGAQQRQW